MQRAIALVAALGVMVLAGCGSSTADTAIRKTFESGVAQLSEPQTDKQLHDQVVRTLRRLHGERASTATGQRAKTLAVRGFTWMLRGSKARLDLTTNDSGNLEASVRDATRADREMREGARFIRAAGRALGARVGELNGF